MLTYFYNDGRVEEPKVTAPWELKLIKIIEQREEILSAFIAKYGCQPDEIVQVEQHTANGVRWYLVKWS